MAGGRFELLQWQPSGIDQQVQQINQNTRSQLRDLLHTMSPERFEALITDLLLRSNYTNWSQADWFHARWLVAPSREKERL